MSQEAPEIEQGDPIVAALFIGSALILSIAAGYGLSRVFRGEVSRDAYSLVEPRKRFDWSKIFGSDA